MMKTTIYPPHQYPTYSNVSTHIVVVPSKLQKYIPVALTFCTGKVTKIYDYRFKFHDKNDVTRFINALREERKKS